MIKTVRIGGRCEMSKEDKSQLEENVQDESVDESEGEEEDSAENKE